MTQLPTKTPSISRNALFNLAGQMASTLAALVCMPFLVRAIGADRMGLLALIWVLIGYLSILDFGVGPAITKTVAEALAFGQRDRVPTLFWTANRIQTIMGLVGGALIASLAPLLLSRVLHVSPKLHNEALVSLYFCGLAFPFVLVASSVTGLLQAAQRFDLTNAVQVPLSIAQFVLPLLCALYSPRLPLVVGTLLATRVVALALFFRFAFAVYPELTHHRRFSFSEFRALFVFGGWVTISNIVSPLMVYADRFLLGSLRSISLVAYYSVPSDAATRLLIVPRSIAPALFPVFSGTRDTERINNLAARAIKYILLAVGPPVILIAVFAHDLMGLWMGRTFAAQSSLALQFLMAGILACSLSLIPFYLLQAIGRADITAKVHMTELPCYLVLSWVGIRMWGVSGAAMAWSLRLMVETGVLFYLAGRVAGLSARSIVSCRIPHLTASLLALAAAGLAIESRTPTFTLKAGFALVFVLLMLGLIWVFFLDRSDRERCRRLAFCRAGR